MSAISLTRKRGKGMAEQKRAWLYGRVAYDDGITLAVQMDLLRHWTAEHGYAIVGETAEAGSGIRSDRPGLSEVMQAVREKRMDTLVVRKLDRLTRNPPDACGLMEILKGCGVALSAPTKILSPTCLLLAFEHKKASVLTASFKCCKNTRHGAGGGTRTHTGDYPNFLYPQK